MMTVSRRTAVGWLRGLSCAYILLFCSLPFSIDLPLGQSLISAPGEILLLLLALWTAVLAWRRGISHIIGWRHPITVITGIYLLWMGCTATVSTLPWVSAKYTAVALLHAWVGLFGAMLIGHVPGSSGQEQQSFCPDSAPAFFRAVLIAYLLPFLAVMGYAWWIHGQYGFRSDSSNLAARPFYFDHTAYSAVMALLFWAPWSMAGMLRNASLIRGVDKLLRLALLLGIVLSFSRATWLGMMVAALLYAVRWLWNRHRTSAIALAATLLGLALIVILQVFRPPAGDVSTRERLNRYSCAWRMFTDRPLTGFGAGTYPEKYLAYQRTEEMTRISVTDAGPHQPGRGGSAHSEYFLALAELGFPGALCWFLLAGLMILSVFKYPLNTPASNAALALTTFMVHAFFNNFMHTDKIAVLVWLLMAIIAQNPVRTSAGDPK